MKVGIITGASSGMGKQFAICAEKYCELDELWVIARRADKLNELKELVKTKIVPVSLDLTVESSFNVIKNKLLAENPDVKLLINCSGYGKFSTFENSSETANANMCDLNLKAVVLLTQIVLPYVNKDGKIIELGSLSAFLPVTHLSVYAATKAAVLSYSRALNFELKQRGIRVLCVCPYWVKTEFFDRANEKEHIKKLDVIYEPSFVVKKAYKAMFYGNKDYVVPGAYAKLIRFLAKILPHKFLMRIMNKVFDFEQND